MNQKHQKVENVKSGIAWELKAVLPMGEAEGFFFLESLPYHFEKNEPLRAKRVTFELMDGSAYELKVERDPRHAAGSLAGMLARVLKGLVESESNLIRTDESGEYFHRYITFSSLAYAFNSDNNGYALISNKVGQLCREELELPTGRYSEGFVVYLEEYALEKTFNKFGLLTSPDVDDSE